MFMSPDFPLAPGQHNRETLWLTVCVCALSIAVLALPVVAGPRYRTSAPALSGDLRIAGSRAMRGSIERWVGIFRREHPGVRVQIALVGSGAAADAMAQGEADVAPMTRPLQSSEQALFKPAQALPQTIALGRAEAGPSSGAGPWGPVSLYFYFVPVRREAAREFVRIATSAEGSGQSRISLLEAIVGRAPDPLAV